VHVARVPVDHGACVGGEGGVGGRELRHDRRRLFPYFRLEEVLGAEYPLWARSYGTYRRQCRILGRLPGTRWMGGRLVAVLRKDVDA